MPSSHATALSFLAVAHPGGAGGRGRAVWILGAGVATWWRVQAGYHSVLQVVAGWAVGCVNAGVWRMWGAAVVEDGVTGMIGETCGKFVIGMIVLVCVFVYFKFLKCVCVCVILCFN